MYTYTERNIQAHCSWIENIRSKKPFKLILSSMLLISDFLTSLHYWLD